MIFAILLMPIGDSNKDHWIVFIRSLQFIIILALVNIPITSLNIESLQILNNIAFYDILGNYDVWSFIKSLKFNNNDVPYIVQQMQTISFNNTNAFLGLGTVSVYLLAYFAQVFLTMVFKILSMIKDKKYIKKELY